MSGQFVNLFDCFFYNYKKNPKKIFLSTTKTDYTYEQIYHEIIRIFNLIKYKKINKSIAVFTSNSFYFISSFLACNLIDIACLIIPQNSNKYEIELINKDIEINLCLTTSENVDKIANKFDSIILDINSSEKNNYDLTEIIEDYIDNNINHASSFYKNAIIQFSSGTTGKSKSIIRTNQSLIEEVYSIIDTLEINSNDKIMTILPLSYSFSFGSAFVTSLFVNSRLYVYEKILPSQLVKFLVQNQIAILLSVPFLYELLTRISVPKKYSNLSFMKHLISSGAKLEKRIQRLIKRKYNKNLSNQYGSTETGALFINKSGYDTSLGSPCANIKYKIDDSTNELLIYGRSFSNNSPKVDNKSGVYNTGDIVKIKKDKIFFEKRKDKTINIGSQKVSHNELENILKNLDYVKLAKINHKFTNKIVANVIINCEKTEEEIKHDLKKLTMDYKIPTKIKIEVQRP